jgi:hypothetical protein
VKKGEIRVGRNFNQLISMDLKKLIIWQKWSKSKFGEGIDTYFVDFLI